jgi:hypothetical protein
MVGGAGLALRSKVSMESARVLCVDVDIRLPRACFSMVRALGRTGDVPRDALGVANGSIVLW